MLRNETLLAREKRSGDVNVSTSLLTNPAVLNQMANAMGDLDMGDVEQGSREGDKSEGGEEPIATATEICKTPSTQDKESGLLQCYCCFNADVKLLNQAQ